MCRNGKFMLLGSRCAVSLRPVDVSVYEHVGCYCSGEICVHMKFLKFFNHKNIRVEKLMCKRAFFISFDSGPVCIFQVRICLEGPILPLTPRF